MKRLERPSNITDHVIIHSCPSDGRCYGSLTSPHPPSPVTQLMFLAALGWPVSPLRPPWHPPPSAVTFPTFPVTRTCRPVSFSSERATRGRDISLSACLIRNSLAVGLTALIERARQELSLSWPRSALLVNRPNRWPHQKNLCPQTKCSLMGFLQCECIRGHLEGRIRPKINAGPLFTHPREVWTCSTLFFGTKKVYCSSSSYINVKTFQ